MLLLRNKTLMGLVVLIAWMGAACTQAFPTAQSSDAQPTPTRQIAAVPEQDGEAESEAESTESMEETQPPAATDVPTEVQPSEPTTIPPTEVPTETTPLGSPELHATDPSTVSLASGKVQLVEFFAFW